jgi:hypothetical protein
MLNNGAKCKEIQYIIDFLKFNNFYCWGAGGGGGGFLFFAPGTKKIIKCTTATRPMLN